MANGTTCSEGGGPWLGDDMVFRCWIACIHLASHVGVGWYDVKWLGWLHGSGFACYGWEVALAS